MTALPFVRLGLVGVLLAPAIAWGQARPHLTVGKLEAPNVAPAVDLNGAEAGADSSATFTPGDGAVLIVDGDASDGEALFVADNTNHLVSATIRLTNDLDAHRETLAVITTGTNIVATLGPAGASRTLTLSGFDSRSAYQQVLRTVTYNNTVALPNTAQRLIEFTLNDGSLASAVAVSRVTISFPVRITSIVRESDADIVLTGIGVPNSTITIQTSLDLSANSFGPIGNATVNASGVWQLVDGDDLTRRFYRIAP